MSDIMPSGATSPFDALRRIDESGADHWSARELAPIMGYDKWERFAVATDRARTACENSTGDAAHHFRPSSKIVKLGAGATRTVDDWRLSRHGSYLVAMNGDPRKPEIAAAQTYFAVKTREAEMGVGPSLSAHAGAPQSQMDMLVAAFQGGLIDHETASRRARQIVGIDAPSAEPEPAIEVPTPDVDAWAIVARHSDGLHAGQVAAEMLGRQADRAEVEKARRRLDALVRRGELDRTEEDPGPRRGRAPIIYRVRTQAEPDHS